MGIFYLMKENWSCIFLRINFRLITPNRKSAYCHTKMKLSHMESFVSREINFHPRIRQHIYDLIKKIRIDRP